MWIRGFFVLLTLFVAAMSGNAKAAGTFISAPSRFDMVHDDARNLIYISSDGIVLRYDVATSSFLTPVSLGGSLGGMDISPDSQFLAVADRNSFGSLIRVHKIELNTLQVSSFTATRVGEESGVWTVAYGADGSLLTSPYGTNWLPFRKFDAVTGTTSVLAQILVGTMLSASGDGQTIAFAEPFISDGPWGLYDLPTGDVVRRGGYDNGTSRFNFEIATDRMGAQFAIPTYGGTFIYDHLYNKVATLGVYAGPQPVGVAYHPVERLAYFPWAESTNVRAYDMNSFSLVGTHDFEHNFAHTGNSAFGQGRIRLSRDGSLLMVSVTNGVRILRQYAPLSAAPVASPARPGWKSVISLRGSIGNGGSLSYAISQPPKHGRALMLGNKIHYTSVGDFVGTDTFRYQAKYGRAISEATINIIVAAPITSSKNAKASVVLKK